MKCMAANATIKLHSVCPRDQNSELSKQCTLVEQPWLHHARKSYTAVHPSTGGQSAQFNAKLALTFAEIGNPTPFYLGGCTSRRCRAQQ